MKKTALTIVLLVLALATTGAAAPKGDAAFTAGLKAYNSKNYKAAVTRLKDYVNRRPDPVAYYLIGYSLYELKKFDEADEYFRQAYLIDPEFSLEKVGLISRDAAPAPVAVPARQKQGEPADSGQQKPAAPAAPDQKAVEQTPVPAPAPKSPVTSQAAPQVQKPVVPAPAAPQFPAPKKQLPGGLGPAALVGMVAAFGMVALLVAVALYAFFCFCMYLIAKKLNVPAPWTAWIPLVQIWTFVMCAGKPAWWILLLFIPFVNIVIGVYLWMCITENLGKNKWLGLLILVPVVSIIYPVWLAFSKAETTGGYDTGETLTD